MTSEFDEKNRYPLLQVTFNPEWDFVNDHVGTFGVEMALMHNVLIRCLNSIYDKATRVKPGDEVAFAGYSLAFTELMHAHHEGEEQIIFPFLQTKHDMSHNVDQHKAFTKNMATFEDYMKAVYNKKDSYDGEKVRQLVEAFGDTLVEHLNDEIPTLSPERLGEYDRAEFDAMLEEHAKWAKTLSVPTVYNLIGTHCDVKAVPTWPHAPWLVKWLVSNVFYWRHRSYWKFSPYDRHAQPQEY